MMVDADLTPSCHLRLTTSVTATATVSPNLHWIEIEIEILRSALHFFGFASVSCVWFDTRAQFAVLCCVTTVARFH